MKITRIQIDKLITHLNNGHTLLVPNLRTKDAILDQYFDKLQKTTIPTPVIFPIDIFIKKHYPTKTTYWIRSKRF